MKNKVIISSVNMEERANLGIKAGDTVRVWLKIEEKGKVRLQAFEGLVLARKHGSEAGGTFTVRKVSSGVGVEKIFPLYSPIIDKIEIVKRAKVRRAKLYFIRDKVAREVKRILRSTVMMNVATKGAIELEAERKIAEEEENKRQEETKRAEEIVEKEQENGGEDTSDAKKEDAKEIVDGSDESEVSDDVIADEGEESTKEEEAKETTEDKDEKGEKEETTEKDKEETTTEEKEEEKKAE